MATAAFHTVSDPSQGGPQGMTRHARVRLQQRAIPPMIVGLLEQFGSEFRSGDADIIMFDKAAKKKLTHAFGGPRGLKAFEPWLDAYVVMSNDGSVLTAGHRHSRVAYR